LDIDFVLHSEVTLILTNWKMFDDIVRARLGAFDACSRKPAEWALLALVEFGGNSVWRGLVLDGGG
jgi:hypothetical protein